MREIRILAEHYENYEVEFLVYDKFNIVAEFLIHPEMFDLAICLN